MKYPLYQRFCVVALVAFSFCTIQQAFAQQGVLISGSAGAADNSAMLDIVSTSKGVLVPRMNAAQRGAISSPATGLMVYQTDAPSGYYYYNGSQWILMGSNGVAFSGGGGTVNYVPKWTASNTISGTSLIYDNGTSVGINTTSPGASYKLDVGGDMHTSGVYFVGTKGSGFGNDQGGNIELGADNSTANTTNAVPYIDFHFGTGSAQDFNVRLTNDANGVLSLIGQLKITGGSPGAGKVLTSDGNGLASWVAPASSGVGGLGTAGQVAFWTAGTTLSSSGNLNWDNTNGRLGVGTSAAGTNITRLNIGGGGWSSMRSDFNQAFTNIPTYMTDATDAALFTSTTINGVLNGLSVGSDNRLYIEDDLDDAFSIWGNSCAGVGCFNLTGSLYNTRFFGNGTVQMRTLAGTGNRPVYADANGVLSTSPNSNRIYASKTAESAAIAAVNTGILTTGTINVVAGEVIEIVVALELHWTGGSGNDRFSMQTQVNNASCGIGNTVLSTTISAMPSADHQGYYTYFFTDLWTATCTGGVSFQCNANRFDADDSWTHRNARIMAIKQ